jgi:putative transcriptional regulator
MSKGTMSAKAHGNGRIATARAEGSGRLFPDRLLAPMTEAESRAAASTGPDGRPLTQEELARVRKAPAAKRLRRTLGLTQEEFAVRYRIPIGTLRDWEQGRSEPDQPARAYLTVIARNPEAVRRALGRKAG